MHCASASASPQHVQIVQTCSALDFLFLSRRSLLAFPPAHPHITRSATRAKVQDPLRALDRRTRATRSDPEECIPGLEGAHVPQLQVRAELLEVKAPAPEQPCDRSGPERNRTQTVCTRLLHENGAARMFRAAGLVTGSNRPRPRRVRLRQTQAGDAEHAHARSTGSGGRDGNAATGGERRASSCLAKG